jgi:nuclear transcription Y subunit beta
MCSFIGRYVVSDNAGQLFLLLYTRRRNPATHSKVLVCYLFHLQKALPPNAKVAKDGKDTVQECVSEFVSFITSEASDKCQREKRKTINGDDILWAMSTLGFDKYIDPLKQYLARYRETVMQEKGDDNAGGAKKEEK